MRPQKTSSAFCCPSDLRPHGFDLCVCVMSFFLLAFDLDKKKMWAKTPHGPIWPSFRADTMQDM